jgi:putative Mg2+ transporter-C (MgtC) family protein
MHPMPLVLTPLDLASRLAATMIAGSLIGLNRSGHGRAAGLRTTILVCLAASLSMIEANLLLETDGKTPASFPVLDLMRLPLGILSGMGFIGAGAIIKKGEMALGVTTAATLWITTMIGLCLGGGQIVLGVIALTLALLALCGMKRFERGMEQDRRATLTVLSEGAPDVQDFIWAELERDGLQIIRQSVTYREHGQWAELKYVLKWRCTSHETKPPSVISSIAGHRGISEIQWHPTGLTVS